MKNDTSMRGTATRRRLLRDAALGGSTLALWAILPAGVTSAATESEPGIAQSSKQDPVMQPTVDTSHATPAVAKQLVRYFRRKSARDLEGTMAFFAQRSSTYIDATLGWQLASWDELYDFFATYMPTWPEDSASYPVRILGDTRSALVFFTDTAGLFGPSELRLAGAVDFERGLITRQVDYWDGRHFGLDNLASLQLPADQFPHDFRESTVGGSASAVMRRVVRHLAGALRQADGAAAAKLFAPDAVFEDVPSHISITGRASIEKYLKAASGLLPYAGARTAVRHVLGNDVGGGYEFMAADGPVPRGIVGLELDSLQRISRLTALWDGSLVSDDALLSLAARAVER
ncbi:hypothetical protein [Streptomyces sp. NPDC085937]|uniref:hypothetical protein n=1 Tax=Streptomyces sp. NPDC085937 TaxID=3365742 RepID=UPI0037D532C8